MDIPPCAHVALYSQFHKSCRVGRNRMLIHSVSRFQASDIFLISKDPDHDILRTPPCIRHRLPVR